MNGTYPKQASSQNQSQKAERERGATGYAALGTAARVPYSSVWDAASPLSNPASCLCTPWEAADEGSTSVFPATHGGTWMEVLAGSRPRPGPAVAVTRICAMKQQMEARARALSLSYSALQINK